VATYREAARQLLTACRAYLDQKASLADLKAAVWEATEQIVLVDDRDLPDFSRPPRGGST
jgi:hypothetical protein